MEAAKQVEQVEQTDALSMTVDGKVLNKALRALKPTLNLRGYQVNLMAVDIKAQGNTATLSVSDRATNLSVTIPAEGSGSARPFFKPFADAAKGEKGLLRITRDGDKVRVDGSLLATVDALRDAADEIPTPMMPEDVKIQGTMPKEDFLLAATATKPFVSKDLSGPESLRCVHLEHIDGRLRAVGCDNHRIIAVPVDGIIDGPINIMGRGLSAVAGAVKAFGASTIDLWADNHRCYILSGAVKASIQVIDSQYPDFRTLDAGYETAIPIHTDQKKQVMAALDRMAKMGGAEPDVILKISQNGGFTMDFNTGRYRSDKDAQQTATYTTPDFEPDRALERVAFQPRFLLDAMKAFPGGFTWHQKGPESGVKITDGEIFTLTLPVKII